MKSSSTSSTSFCIPSFSVVASPDANSFASKTVPSGCIKGILRPIFCSASLQTHPSGQVPYFKAKLCENQQELQSKGVKQAAAKGSSPGLVARLMGLDSTTQVESLNTQILPDSITRSRSMDSFDYYKSATDQMQEKHWRVKSSLSNLDFIELEDENFFILSFENESRSRKFGSRRRICETDSGESKQRQTNTWGNRTDKGLAENKHRKTVQCKNSGNRTDEALKPKNMEDSKNDMNALNSLDENYKPTREVMGCVRAIDSTSIYCSSKHDEAVNEDVKFRRKHTDCACMVDSVADECSSEDSSPVCVLDLDRFIADRETTKTTDKSLRMKDSNPRRRLSPELEAYEHDHDSIEDDGRMKKTIRRIEDGFNHNYSGIQSKVCRITETDITESEWVGRKVIMTHEDYKEINQDVESQVLDQLLEETVAQLVDFL